METNKLTFRSLLALVPICTGIITFALPSVELFGPSSVSSILAETTGLSTLVSKIVIYGVALLSGLYTYNYINRLRNN